MSRAPDRAGDNTIAIHSPIPGPDPGKGSLETTTGSLAELFPGSGS
ncbi:hypothetical protein [Rhodococcus sp. ACT016]